MEESRKEKRQRRKPNVEDVEPRRSLRLAKKKVTMGRQGTVDDPEVLPYYMAAVERGYAGARQSDPRVFPEEEDTPMEEERQEPAEQGEEVAEEAGEEDLQEEL